MYYLFACFVVLVACLFCHCHFCRYQKIKITIAKTKTIRNNTRRSYNGDGHRADLELDDLWSFNSDEIATRVRLAGAHATSAVDVAATLADWQQIREAQSKRENIEISMEDAQAISESASEMEDTQGDTQEDYVMTWTYSFVGTLAYRQLVINNEDVGPPEVVGLDLVFDIGLDLFLNSLYIVLLLYFIYFELCVFVYFIFCF